MPAGQTHLGITSERNGLDSGGIAGDVPFSDTNHRSAMVKTPHFFKAHPPNQSFTIPLEHVSPDVA